MGKGRRAERMSEERRFTLIPRRCFSFRHASQMALQFEGGMEEGGSEEAGTERQSGNSISSRWKARGVSIFPFQAVDQSGAKDVFGSY